MTLQEIKDAVERGDRVIWSNESYVVKKDTLGQWHIVCELNDNCIGLTWKDGVTLNGKPSEFRISGSATPPTDALSTTT